MLYKFLFCHKRSKCDFYLFYQIILVFEREIGNLKKIKDNHPKYIITMDPLASMINDDGIKIIQAIDFLQG